MFYTKNSTDKVWQEFLVAAIFRRYYHCVQMIFTTQCFFEGYG
jgi:hypothetical protein